MREHIVNTTSAWKRRGKLIGNKKARLVNSPAFDIFLRVYALCQMFAYGAYSPSIGKIIPCPPPPGLGSGASTL